MNDSKQELLLPVVEPSAHTRPAPSTSDRNLTPAQLARRTVLALLGVAGAAKLIQPLSNFSFPGRSTNGAVKWKACGERMECTTISAPLDWHNSSDPRMATIAVAKHKADPTKARLGSIFINPGGPGGSGSAFAHLAGPLMSAITDGRYDIIGFDPRGINETRPYVSCFDSALDEHLYQLTAPTSLDIPVNFSAIAPGSGSSSNPQAVLDHLSAQVRVMGASFGALYAQCESKSGDALAYVGTEAVVRDIHHIAKLIDGPEAKINFWGLSYGTIVGQYLTAILPAERIGRVVMDGVVDWESWSRHTIKDFAPLADTDRVLEVFASACASAGSSCALSHLGSARAILAAIDGVIDELYAQPAPVLSIPQVPGLLVRSYHARQLAFLSAYSIKAWPLLADAFAAALEGDHSLLLARAVVPLTGSWDAASQRADSSLFSTHAIRCADQPPYNAEAGDPEPTAVEVTENIVRGLEIISPRFAEQVADLSWCHLWPAEKKSLYTGGFEMKADALETAVLIFNQRLDPITPLNSAKKAMVNYGNNARLVEQNGTGHCAIGQASLASARIMRKYWVHGVVPEAEHSFTEVDELGFETVTSEGVSALSAEDRELLEAWTGVGEALYAV